MIDSFWQQFENYNLLMLCFNKKKWKQLKFGIAFIALFFLLKFCSEIMQYIFVPLK